MNHYDGTTGLQKPIADLLGLSYKSQREIAKATKRAKIALGIMGKRTLPPADRVKVYEYLKAEQADKLKKTVLPIETLQDTPLLMDDESVEIPLQSQAVELSLQDEGVEIISQGESVEKFSQHSPLNDFDSLRVAFYVKKRGIKTRLVIALDGFLVNALMKKTGIDRQALPKWVQEATNRWTAFDPLLPVTRQVKMLIIRCLMGEL